MTSTSSSLTLNNRTDLLSPGLVLLLASGAGFSVATLYYSQPILGVLGSDIQASEGAVGMVPMLTQLGYALGILLLRRWVIAMTGAGSFWQRPRCSCWLCYSAASPRASVPCSPRAW